MWRCTSSTTASVKNPRAMPDWLVTMTTRSPARLSARIASMRPGIQLDAFGPIEIADFLDERAVAIEEDGRLGVHGFGLTASAAPQPTHARRRRDAAHAAVIERALAQHAGRHQTSCVSTTMRRRAERAAFRRSSVGPNIAVTSTPSAAAKCIAPESLRHERAAVRPARRRASGRSVRPIRLSDRDAGAATRLEHVSRRPTRRPPAADEHRAARRRSASASRHAPRTTPAATAWRRRTRRPARTRRAARAPSHPAALKQLRARLRAASADTSMRGSQRHRSAKPSALTRCW